MGRWYPPRLTPICSDTEPDTDTDSVMLDLRALPVSMLLTCPCPVLPDTSTTERGRLRLSPTSDTDSDMPDTDTLELDSRALPVSTLPMFPPCNGLGYGYHYGKREAEAEPFYGYAGLGYAGLGYAGLGYGYGIHSSHVGLCTNYLGAAVPC